MNLTEMIMHLLDGWDEEVTWTEMRVGHSEECFIHQLGLTVAELRHFSCECPRTPYRIIEFRRQIPLLTSLVESSYSAPVTGESTRSGTKVEAPLPGNLGAYDSVMRMISSAVWTLSQDWSLPAPATLVGGLEAIRLEIGARLANERDDAAALLGPAVRAARIHLGYESRPIRIFCDCDGLIVHREGALECTGDCGRVYAISEALERALAAQERSLAVLELCRRQHAPNWRTDADGKRRCRSCDAERKQRRQLAKASAGA